MLSVSGSQEEFDATLEDYQRRLSILEEENRNDPSITNIAALSRERSTTPPQLIPTTFISTSNAIMNRIVQSYIYTILDHSARALVAKHSSKFESALVDEILSYTTFGRAEYQLLSHPLLSIQLQFDIDTYHAPGHPLGVMLEVGKEDIYIDNRDIGDKRSIEGVGKLSNFIVRHRQGRRVLDRLSDMSGKYYNKPGTVDPMDMHDMLMETSNYSRIRVRYGVSFERKEDFCDSEEDDEEDNDLLMQYDCHDYVGIEGVFKAPIELQWINDVLVLQLCKNKGRKLAGTEKFCYSVPFVFQKPYPT